jgi:4-azaleucine resistance transporter AzlC
MDGTDGKTPARGQKSLARRAFIDSLPVLMGYTTMGFAAGVLMASRGDVPFAPIWSFLTAAAFVSGTLSFAIVPWLADSAPLAVIALATLAINFRYAFYGFSMLSRWRDVPLLKRLYLIHMLTDENYALEVSSPLKDPKLFERYCLRLSVFNHSYWIVGCTAGAAAVYALEQAFSAERIQEATRGIEFAMVALFLVIFTDQMRGFVARER